MNTQMYENKITQDNIKKLRDYNFIIIEPKENSRLACGDIGRGALADVNIIINKTLEILGLVL